MDLELVEPFIRSTKEIVKQMADIDLELNGLPDIGEGEVLSYGVASVINFSGKIKGRFVIDMEPGLALTIAGNMLGEECRETKDRMLLAAISEMNNIIVGDANTNINNKYSLGLRLATPIVLAGKNIIIATPQISFAALVGKTAYGNIRLNIGYQGGVI
jgi:chemotaxis protein CheX